MEARAGAFGKLLLVDAPLLAGSGTAAATGTFSGLGVPAFILVLDRTRQDLYLFTVGEEGTGDLLKLSLKDTDIPERDVEALEEGILMMVTLGERGGAAKPTGTGVPGASGRLVHMTTPEAASLIKGGNPKVIIGNNYAGPASNASRTGWSLTARTGLSPTQTHVPMHIPATGEAAFSQVRPIGIATGWQRLTGQQYTARGILNLETGVFTRTGVNWNQVGFYAVDIVIDGVVVGTAYVYGNDK